MASIIDRILNPLGYVRKNDKSLFLSTLQQEPKVVEKSNTKQNAIMLDPAASAYRLFEEGQRKPTPITFDTLRRISKFCAVARICINTLKHEVTQVGWSIVPVDPKKQVNQAQIEQVTNFFKQPNPNNETFRTFCDKILEDLLVLDAVAIEKVNTIGGDPFAMYYVDAATIRPCFDKHGTQGDPAYVQYLPTNSTGKPDAEWSKDEMVYFMQNPQADVKNFGYGLSPIEGIIMVVTNMLNADNYNGAFFEVGTIPRGILMLGEDVKPADVEGFREIWKAEIEGKPWRTPILGGSKNPEWLSLGEPSNRDMQFMEYQLWLLKLIVAAYEMSPQDIGFTMDINKAVGEVQQQISRSQGFRSVLMLLEHYFTQEIIQEWFGFKDLMFKYQDLNPLSAKERAEIANIEVPLGLQTINEYRKDTGRDPIDNGDRAMFISSGQAAFVDQMEIEQENAESIEGTPVITETEKSAKKGHGKVEKTVTLEDYICWVDDSGYSQPFVFTDKLKTYGKVIKPPVSVDIDGPHAEERLIQKAISQNLNVPYCKIVPESEIWEHLPAPDLARAFEEYQDMKPAYYSKKWHDLFGMSRKFDFYSVVEYVPGRKLSDHAVIEDMKRSPNEYIAAIADLADLSRWEESVLAGERRLNHYIITPEKRAYGIDYQIEGDVFYWEMTKDDVYNLLLKEVPQLAQLYMNFKQNVSE